MDPRSGAARAGTRTTPVCVEQPSSPSKNYKSRAYGTPLGAIGHVSRTHSARHHRWHRRRTLTVTLCDIVAWAAFTVVTVAVLLAACAVLWVIA